MSFVDSLIYRIKRIFRRKVERKVEQAVEKEIDKAFDKQMKKEGVEIKTQNADGTVNENQTPSQALKEADSAQQVVINVNNPDSNAGKAATNIAMSMQQAQEIMKYLILDENQKVIGVKDDAPDYLKEAYAKGEFND